MKSCLDLNKFAPTATASWKIHTYSKFCEHIRVLIKAAVKNKLVALECSYSADLLYKYEQVKNRS